MFSLKHYRITALLQMHGPNGEGGAWQRVILRCSEMELPHVLSALRLSGSGQYDVTEEDFLRNALDLQTASTDKKQS